MDAIFSRKGDNPRSQKQLGGKYWRRMVTSQQVCAALRKLRTDAKLEPQDFADDAGVNRATVYRIDNYLEEPYSPKIETISRLVESRNLTLAAFFAAIEGATAMTPETVAPTLVDPESDDFEALLDRKIEDAVDRRLREAPPAGSPRGRSPATSTKSARVRRPPSEGRKART